MALRSTYTYATMDVSKSAHEEIKQRLIAAGYDQALHDKGETLDMHGIALTVEPPPPIAQGALEIGNNGRDVVVNHPDLKPDENGVGHIVFSPLQTINFALLLLKNAAQLTPLYYEVSQSQRRLVKDAPIPVERGLPDDQITVLALARMTNTDESPSWTVAYLEDGDWFEQSTGKCLTVTKWLDLPPEEDGL